MYEILVDGACLSLSAVMQVRPEIVTRASNNWEKLHMYSINREYQATTGKEMRPLSQTLPYLNPITKIKFLNPVA